MEGSSYFEGEILVWQPRPSTSPNILITLFVHEVWHCPIIQQKNLAKLSHVQNWVQLPNGCFTHLHFNLVLRSILCFFSGPPFWPFAFQFRKTHTIYGYYHIGLPRQVDTKSKGKCLITRRLLYFSLRNMLENCLIFKIKSLKTPKKLQVFQRRNNAWIVHIDTTLCINPLTNNGMWTHLLKA